MTFSSPADIAGHLRAELPGHSTEYYEDLVERIVTLAMDRGQNIATVVDSFVTGAILRGEGPPSVARSARNTYD